MRVNPFCLIICLMIVVLCSGTNAIGQSKNSCENINDLVIETSVEPSGNRFKLILKFDDTSLGEYAIVLNQQNSESVVSKNKQKGFDDLKPGQYTVYIVDKKGCSKQININIK